jgi:hypothetical protein
MSIVEGSSSVYAGASIVTAGGPAIVGPSSVAIDPDVRITLTQERTNLYGSISAHPTVKP